MGKKIYGALPIGTLLKSAERTYRVEEVLGAGGFGITYKVSSEIMTGNVPVVGYFAIKEHFLRDKYSREGTVVVTGPSSSMDFTNSRKEFLNEARRLSAVSSSQPNIVKVNESFSANNTSYYVMEYIDGDSLRTYVEKNGEGGLRWEDALKIIEPVAGALSYLHKNRINHLDIKPDNILLDSRKGGRPVVIDFGMAKQYDSKGNPTKRLSPNGYSQGYAPIEQYVGITSFSPATDVYALAATLLFLLTGKDPAKPDILTESSVRTALQGKAPEYAIDGIAKALRYDKAARTGSVGEFLRSIKYHDKSKGEEEDSPNPNDNYDSKDNPTKPIDPKPKENGIQRIKRLPPAVIYSVIAVLFLFLGFGVFRILNSGGSLISPAPYEEDFVLLSDGAKYYGDVNEDGLPNGYGKAVYPDSSVYIGNWTLGKWNGIGRSIAADGTITFGSFANGKTPAAQPFRIGDRVYGVDVSKYQRHIDWDNIYLPADSDGVVSATEDGGYKQPVFFALLKATDGMVDDPFYERNYLNAKRAGIVCGAYHFLTLKRSVDEQVRQFIETSHLEEGDLPPVLDLEIPNETMKDYRKEVCDMALEWLEKIETYYGVRPIIYTYAYFKRDYLANPKFDHYDYFIASHRSTPPDVNNWVIWQFSETLRLPSIPDNSVDLDLFNGDLDKFREYVRKYGIRGTLEGNGGKPVGNQK